MATLEELSIFNGSEEEYQQLLEKEVAAGAITEEVADALYNAFSAKTTETAVPTGAAFSASTPEDEIKALEQFVTSTEKPELSFLEQLQQEQLSAMTQAASTGEEMPSMDMLRNRVTTGYDFPLSGLRDEELAQMAEAGDENAMKELESRKILAEQSFIESLSNPDLYARTSGAAAKGISQITTMPEALLGLGASGIESVTGLDIGGETLLNSYAKKQQDIERALGVSSALTPTESLAESLTGALVPGGLLMKGVGLGTDFMLDQTVRELTDDVGERYETVFDRVGLTDNNSRPVLGSMAAMGVVLLGGAITARSIDNLSKWHIARTGTQIRDVKSIDVNAPKGLVTTERASDLTKANVVDEQAALRDIIRRQGVPDFDDISTRIELDTHAASRTRIEEAVNTGKLSSATASFNSPIAPRVLYDAYQGLDHATKANIAKYINLKDLRDDTLLAITNGKATNADLLIIDNQLQNIVKIVPEAEEFSKRYNSVTSALRTYAEGSLFSPTYKTRLDATRPNYVPLELSSVDPDAPLLQRMYQAQTQGGKADQEWFMQNRATLGQYDMKHRADPFDMLLQSVEATLNARMKNDTKVAIVDGLLNSSINQGLSTNKKFLIKKATAQEAADNPERLIRIYRNGEKETYITSKLTAQLTQFDPYIAKYPALFIPKRLFEQVTVGPLSITFAPVTMLRDTLGGRVTAPNALLAPNALDVAKAIPQQLWAKALGGISSHFQQSFVSSTAPLPTWLMDAPAQKRFGDNVAQAYTQTLYHQANTVGGFDASLMKERIQVGQGALEELKRTIKDAGGNINLSPNLEPALKGAKFSAQRVLNMIEGFTNVFNSIQDAPRFAAVTKNVAAGMPVDEATMFSRRLTGDVSKSGRVYQASGFRMGVDAVDQGLLNFANKGIGATTELLRESTPFFNPMIQGNRQLLSAMIEDPVGFNIKAWQNIGLPALAIFGWNEMLGQEYNDYAMNERSGSDTVMTLYMGIPGKPPQEGIEIPLMHELLLYSAPFTRGLYGLSRGENSARTQAALALVAENILSNSVEVGQVAANVMGFSAPETLMQPTEGVYKIREDNIGVLPENMEFLARTLFASVGDTAIHTANAVAGDPTFETFYSELRDRTMDSMPIAKNLAGMKKSNTYFSIPSAMTEQKFESIRNFRQYYDAYFSEDHRNADDLQKPTSGNDFTKFGNAKNPVENPLSNPDMPFLMIGPEQMEEPSNPLYKEFGPMLIENLFRGEIGMTALISRENQYSKYLRRLKAYNNGDKDALNEWQALVNGIEATDENTQELQDLLRDGGYDLSSYTDRIKLINEIEHRRADIINSQLDTFENVEDQITAILQERNELGPNERFQLTKHLDPFDPAPLQ